jgi:hypothetical protein
MGKVERCVEGYGAEADVQERCQNQAILGLTKNEAAITKYLKALPVNSAISEETLQMAHMRINVLSHDSLASKDRETLRRLTMVIAKKGSICSGIKLL